jgi:Ring finger domain
VGKGKKETTATDYYSSDGDGLSDDGIMLEMEEFFDDASMIILPNLSGDGGKGARGGGKGTNTTSTCKAPMRQVPNGCAICLTTMDVNDRITFSSDPKCNHIFHEDCMMDWLVASGRKFLKRQRREVRNHSSENNTAYRYNCHNPIEKILSFPMLCPCCRQPFVRTTDDDEDDEDSDGDVSLAKPSTTSRVLIAAVSTDPELQPVAASGTNDEATSFHDVEALASRVVQDDTIANDVDGGNALPPTSAVVDADEPTHTAAAATTSSPTTLPLDVAVGSDDEYSA